MAIDTDRPFVACSPLFFLTHQRMNGYPRNLLPRPVVAAPAKRKSEGTGTKASELPGGRTAFPRAAYPFFLAHTTNSTNKPVAPI